MNIITSGRPGRIYASALAMVMSSSVGFDAQSVVDGDSELLFAAEVTLGGLGGDVTEQELNLIQFAAGEMTEAGPAKDRPGMHAT